MVAAKKCPDELMDRGVRLVFELGRPIAHVARDLGVSAEALRTRVRRAEVDAGKREGLTTDEREELKRLRSEVFELRRANSILKEASVFFAKELDPHRPR
jgi:transposase